MKRIILNIFLAGLFFFIFQSRAHSFIFIDASSIPGLPGDTFFQVLNEVNNTISGNARNYPSAFALANVGGYPVGDAYIGDSPHMFFGVSAALGCGNMKYYDENFPRYKNIYPAYAPNATLFFGFGIGKGFDILIKAMVYTSDIYRPPLDQKSAKLTKLIFYSAGAKIRKNLVGKKTLIPYIFNFGGVTLSAGCDFMEGIIGIKGEYKYSLGSLSVSGIGSIPLTLNAYYNFNLKWLMFAPNAQLLVYVDFLWIFDLYAGFGAALNSGYIHLDGSGLGNITAPNLLDPMNPISVGSTFAIARYKYKPRPFMGLFIAGLEINLWILKLNFETMVNITNGKDISLQVGTRFQF